MFLYSLIVSLLYNSKSENGSFIVTIKCAKQWPNALTNYSKQSFLSLICYTFSIYYFNEGLDPLFNPIIHEKELKVHKLGRHLVVMQCAVRWDTMVAPQRHCSPLQHATRFKECIRRRRGRKNGRHFHPPIRALRPVLIARTRLTPCVLA